MVDTDAIRWSSQQDSAPAPLVAEFARHLSDWTVAAARRLAYDAALPTI